MGSWEEYVGRGKAQVVNRWWKKKTKLCKLPPFSDTGGTELLSVSSAEPKSVPPQTPRHPCNTHDCKDLQCRIWPTHCKSLHTPPGPLTSQASWLAKLKVQIEIYSFVPAAVVKQPHSLFFPKWVILLEFPDLIYYSPTKSCIGISVR